MRGWRGRGSVRGAVPAWARRLVAHEVRALHSLALWVARRRHGAGPGAYSAAYTGPQTALLFGLVFVAVVETVVLALLIPWPAVHRIVLFVDVYTVIQILGLHAACVTRPHVVGADGSLRIRYGGFWDVQVPAASVRSVRVDARYSHTKQDGVLGLTVGGQTNVTVELAEPLPYARPLGRSGQARVAVRLHADDPRGFVAAARAAAGGAAAGRAGADAGVGAGAAEAAAGAGVEAAVTPERTGPSPRPGPPA
ncbi:hypothetical protein [Streptomyces hypolithicus]